MHKVRSGFTNYKEFTTLDVTNSSKTLIIIPAIKVLILGSINADIQRQISSEILNTRLISHMPRKSYQMTKSWTRLTSHRDSYLSLLHDHLL